jgi:hypothetical protein
VGSVKINDEELSSLHGEQPVLWVIYLAIRRYMDYETGIAGLRRRFNREYFFKSTEIRQVSGRKAARITKDTLRNSLKRLENIGLLRPFGNYVFECLKADRDPLVQKSFTRALPELYPSLAPNEGKKNNHKFLNNKHNLENENHSFTRALPELYPSLAPLPVYTGLPVFDSKVPPDSSLEKCNSLPQDNLRFSDEKTVKVRKFKKFTYCDEEFVKFWESYPKGTTKHESYLFWTKEKLGVVVNEILDDIAWRKSHDPKWQLGEAGQRYILDPIRYLKRRCWEDDREKMVTMDERTMEEKEIDAQVERVMRRRAARSQAQGE